MILPGLAGLAGVTGRRAPWRLNPLDMAPNGVALSNGNLRASISTASRSVRATRAIPAGVRAYCEFTFVSGNHLALGFMSAAMSLTANPETETDAQFYETTTGWVWNNGGSIQGKYATPIQSSPGAVIGMAIDTTQSAPVGNVSVNGAWYRFAPGSSAGTLVCSVGSLPFVGSAAGSGVVDWNVGETPFVSAPPSGFVPLSKI